MSGNNKEKKKGVRRVKRWQKILIGVLVVLLVIAGGVYGFVLHKLGKIERDPDLDLSALKTVQVPGYRNIVLLGIDTRSMEVIDGTRSDAIMIASINEETKAVRVTSIYRDTLVKMGDWDNYEKITHAHAYGGAEMALATIDQAMDIDATEYILFNFKAVADVVDAIGGITLDVKDYEVKELNRITRHTARVLGVEEYATCEGPGEQTLDGVQAVAYGRIRKGVGDDYKRTERMRIVIGEMLEEVRGMSVKDLNKIMDLVLPQIRTNLTSNQILDLLADINKYELTESLGFPFQKYATYVDNVSVVVPLDLAADVSRWHEKLFGQKDYKVSEQCQEISDHIKESLLPEDRRGGGAGDDYDDGYDDYEDGY